MLVENSYSSAIESNTKSNLINDTINSAEVIRNTETNNAFLE